MKKGKGGIVSSYDEGGTAGADPGWTSCSSRQIRPVRLSQRQSFKGVVKII
ncbi:hypothetical protein [Roseiconus lacunae]|uniref:hypothetical protein n=1 Tax=Roseiconus lacunae TaxID=2605694 RepID=UPI001358F6DB|nr:hypothetical protein [Roseiconus lacunae]MCD0457928.1 hypothetical protein [Roseiconus lacunae]